MEGGTTHPTHRTGNKEPPAGSSSKAGLGFREPAYKGQKALLGQLIRVNQAPWGVQMSISAPQGTSVGTTFLGATSRPVWLRWTAWPCTSSSGHSCFLPLPSRAWTPGNILRLCCLSICFQRTQLLMACNFAYNISHIGNNEHCVISSSKRHVSCLLYEMFGIDFSSSLLL